MTDTKPKAVRRLGDIVFANLAFFAGVSILATLATVAAFLFAQSVPAFTGPPIDAASEGFFSYVLPFVFGTVYASVIGLAIATPLAVGIALYISHFANRRFAQILGYAVDLLAAIPSVVYGLWGILVLAPFLSPTFNWLNANLGWIPMFAGQVSATGRTMLTVGIVLAIMVLPIMAALIREIFLQTPTLHEEAALALGATRWEMIKMAVLPFGRPGIISAAMLGLGRALGETMAVAMVLSPSAVIS
ncbi:MAG TPA: phosphate ABC transporter permease subunit PstC, partial [Candidatus Aquiluna sp.]|nr:phosphate ABC transporter permease subunit PstC [Aquiluna sp.]